MTGGSVLKLNDVQSFRVMIALINGFPASIRARRAIIPRSYSAALIESENCIGLVKCLLDAVYNFRWFTGEAEKLLIAKGRSPLEVPWLIAWSFALNRDGEMDRYNPEKWLLTMDDVLEFVSRFK